MSFDLRAVSRQAAARCKNRQASEEASWSSGWWAFARSELVALSSDYNVRHAPSALAQDRVDGLGDLLGADLLEAVWRAEFSVLLRSR